MVTALDSFRDPTPELLSVPPGLPQFFTGSASPCGTTDVEGNIAFFNNLCAQRISASQGITLPQTLFASARTHAAVTVPSTALPFGTYTTINNWSPSQASFGLPVVDTGPVLTNASATYLVTYWMPCVLGAAAAASYEITAQLVYQSPTLAPNFVEFTSIQTFVAAETAPAILATWQFINLGLPGTLEIHVAQNSGQSLSVSNAGTLTITTLNTF